MTLVLVASSSSFAFMPNLSNKDFEATVEYAYETAVDTAEAFASSKGYKLESVSEGVQKPLGIVSRYQAKAGQCTFTVKVGLFFRSSVANVKNCNFDR